jgi:CubicO group peptidase (beta-lactamase class C family)
MPSAGKAEVTVAQVLTHTSRLADEGMADSMFDPGLVGTENLVLHRRLLGLAHQATCARAAALLEEFGLADAASQAD